MFAKKKKKGFTLIELLVVIAIIGILAGIVLVSLSGAQKKAKDARIQADMNQIRTIAQTYASDQLDGNFNGLILEASTDTLRVDIENQGGSSGYATIAGTNPAYCVWAKLNSGSFWCVDSNLVSKGYTASPATCTSADPKCQQP